MLEIDGISKRFGSTVALEGMTFTVRPGELYGFVGANGAGKTTTMRIALGVLEADAGEGRLDGRPLHAAAPPRAARSTPRPAAGSATCPRSGGSTRAWPPAPSCATSPSCAAGRPPTP